MIDIGISVGDHERRKAFHVPLRVPNRARGRAFHAAGLAAGGTEEGAPGIRAHDHPNHRDPDGHDIEAVRHEPENNE